MITKLKKGKEQSPPSLPDIEVFGCFEVGEVFMSCPKNERMLSAHQPVYPLFQGQFSFPIKSCWSQTSQLCSAGEKQ